MLALSNAEGPALSNAEGPPGVEPLTQQYCLQPRGVRPVPPVAREPLKGRRRQAAPPNTPARR